VQANRDANEHDSVHNYRHYSGPIVDIREDVGIAGGTAPTSSIHKIFLCADLRNSEDKWPTNSDAEKD